MIRRMVFVVVFVLLLAGCQSKFQNGDQLKATRDIKVVVNYNSSDLYKPTCIIHEGDRVTVTGFSSLSLGSTEKQGLIQLSSPDCTGWTADDSSLNRKLK